MGQIGLGTLFMNEQVANVDTYTPNTGIMNRSNEYSFSKALDRAKNSKLENADKNDTPKVKDEKTNQVVQKQKDQNKTSKVDNKEEVEIKSEDELDYTKDENDVDERILSLLSQGLNVTTEQLNELLNQMGYKPSDLLNQELFGKFVSEVYTQIKGEDLLMVESGIGNISKIFDQIQSLCDEIKVESNPLNLRKQMNVEVNIEEATQKLVQTEVTIQNIKKTTEAVATGNIEETQLQDVAQTMNAKNVAQLQTKEEPSNTLASAILSENDTVDLGIVVPIQNFSSTVNAQLWQPQETGIMSAGQTPQLIENSIIEQIDFKTLGATKEIHMKLSPKELGDLSIKLVEENSSIVAHIKVDNEKTKAFLVNEMASLKTALEERGLTVADVRVDIKKDEHQSQMEQQKQKSSKRIQEIIAKHMNEYEELEEVIPEKSSDSEVDYMV